MSVPAADIVRAAQSADRKLISGVTVFDLYEGKGIEAGKKSIAIAVTLQPREKTLTDAEIEAVAAKIVGEVSKRTGGTLRYMLPWMAAEIEEIDQVFGGDPWPYGIEPNRATLTGLVQYMAEQGLIAAPVAIEDLFAPTFGLG